MNDMRGAKCDFSMRKEVMGAVYSKGAGN